MMPAHDVATIRSAERELMAGLPAGTLMQRAAAGLAGVCVGLLGQVYGARVVVLAGSGDNGGDALYAGARLARRGATVVAVAAGPRVHEAGMTALCAAGGRATTPGDPALPALIGAAGLVLDGLLGIGGRGGLREPFAGLAELTGRARGRRAEGGPAGTPRPDGPLRPAGLPARGAAGARTGPLVVAVDLPSGIDADTGEVPGTAVQADVTVTFGTGKPGLFIDPGAGHAGVVELIDIGLGPYLPAPAVAVPRLADVAALLPVPPAESDKYRRGVVGIAAGSDRFTGAAALAVGGAVRGGAGMVRLVSAPAAVAVVRGLWPEAVITVTGEQPAGEEIAAAGRVQAWVAGPGMGTGEAARQRLAAVLATDLPVLVDADGLTLAARDPGLLERAAPTLLTPHAGELARLLGADPADVAARRLEHARAAAARFGVTVLLKGSTTVVVPPGRAEADVVPAPAPAGPDGPGGARVPASPGAAPPPGPPSVLVNPTGTSWLATAGTGDVLSGLAGALLAQGLPVAWAAAAAAFLHGLAARLAATGPGRLASGWARPGPPEAALASYRSPAPMLAAAAVGGPATRHEAPVGAGDVLAALPAAIRVTR